MIAFIHTKKLQYYQHMYKHRIINIVLDRMKTVGRETHAAGPARVDFRGAAGGRAYGRHRLGSTARPGIRHPCTLGVSGRPSAAGIGR